MTVRNGRGGIGPPEERRLRVAVLWLGRISRDTGARTCLTELLGPLGLQPGLELDVHVGDPEFEAPAPCRTIRHKVPYVLGPGARIVAEPFVAARHSAHYDVLLAPFNVLPPLWRGPSVLVEHNVLAFGDGLREHLSWLRAQYRPRAVAYSVRRATEIIANSGYLRTLLLAHFPDLDPARVRVVPLGVSSALLRGAQNGAPRRNGHTILVVSALWRHKRVEQAVRVFAKASHDLDRPKLVIAGPGRDAERIGLERLAAELGVRGNVELLGNVTHDRLGGLYASSDVLLYLSDVEAFSLPVIEAMMLGVPVVAKRIPGFVETGGDAPVWVDANAPIEVIAETVRRVLTDTSLRAERIAAGKARASTFTWDRVAEQTAQALRDAVARTALSPRSVRERSANSR